MSLRRPGLGPPLNWTTAAILAAICFHLVSSTPITYPNHSGSVADCAKEATRAVFPVLRFIATNFIAHAFTVKLSPGFGFYYALKFYLWSFGFPYFGVVGAVRTGELLAIREQDPLQRAAQSGALCILARAEKWVPRPGDEAWCWS